QGLHEQPGSSPPAPGDASEHAALVLVAGGSTPDPGAVPANRQHYPAYTHMSRSDGLTSRDDSLPESRIEIDRRLIARVNSTEPMARAPRAATGRENRTQRCAPSPERDRSTRTGMSISRALLCRA